MIFVPMKYLANKYEDYNGTQSGNRESLRTLFSLKFQIIEKSQILNT